MSTTRSPRSGAAPLRGPAAALWLGRFLRDPVGAMLRAYAEVGPVCAAGSLLPLPRIRRSAGRSGRWDPAPEKLHVLALGPACNEQVLGNPALFRTTGQGIGGPRGSAQRRLRYGLTRSQRRQHQRQREFVMPSFQRRAVDATAPRMVEITDKLLSEWSPGSVVDMWGEMRKLTLRLSSDVLFARHDPERSHRLGRMIGEWLDRGFSAPVYAFMVDWPGTPYRALLRHAEAIEREILEMIEEKRAEGAGGNDVISLLVRAHAEGLKWMNDEHLVGQATIFFAASYETTANAMTWTLYLLAQHPELTGELLDEIDASLGGASPTLEALARMPLLEATIKESLRILPPVPYTIRVVTNDALLGPYELRDGDRVILSHYVTHHLPELFAEPERFRPERWFGLRRSQYEYLPFSAGPRLCIGYSFATLALKVATAMILQRFRLSVVPGARIDRVVKVTMSPRRGLPMVIHPPDRGFAVAPVRGDIRAMVDLG